MIDHFAEISAGKYTITQLENLRTNALAKGRPDIAEACDKQIALLETTAPRKGRSRNIDEIAERRGSYTIMASALENGHLRKPELCPLAEEIARYPGVTNVAITKSQISFYLKDHHMTAGIGTQKECWLGVLDETKISEATIARWRGLGVVKSAPYYSTRYVNVRYGNLADTHQALDVTSFV